MRLNIPPPPTPMDFYCDSSSHRNHNYMVAGGLAIRSGRFDQIEAAIQQIKDEAGISSELKWSGYRGGARKEAYQAVVDYLFLLVRQQLAAFHIIICPFSAFDHRRDGEGTPDRSVNKMYFQLLLHRVGRFYGRSCAINVFPDEGNDSKELPPFRGVLCAHTYNRYNSRPDCFKQIRPLDSERCNVIQMVDIVIGGAAALRNNRDLKSPKSELAEYILAASGRPTWERDTAMSARFLTVWNFQVT